MSTTTRTMFLSAALTCLSCGTPAGPDALDAGNAGDDAGTLDAGAPLDAGVPQDAGAPHDGGAPQDGGTMPDAGPSGRLRWSQAYFENSSTNPTPFDRTNGGAVNTLSVSLDGQQAMICGAGVDKGVGPRCFRLDPATGNPLAPAYWSREAIASVLGGFVLQGSTRIDAAGQTLAQGQPCSNCATFGAAEDHLGRVATVVRDSNAYLPVYLARMTPQLQVDPAWPLDRRANITGPVFLVADPSDRVLVGTLDQYDTSTVRRVLASGTPDATFGPAVTDLQLNLVALSDGALVLERTATHDVVRRYTGQGKLDATFAVAGEHALPAGFRAQGLARNEAGAIYVGGTTNDPVTLHADAWVLRLTPQGATDPTWGHDVVKGHQAVRLALNNVAALAVPAVVATHGAVYVGVSASPACYAAVALDE